MQRITALSIARPLLAGLAHSSFLGQVTGLFSRGCYITGTEGQVVALTLAEAGRGPFSIVIKGRPGLFEGISPGQAARVDGRSLQTGSWEITWKTAGVWDPRLVCPAGALDFGPDLVCILKDYAQTPPPNTAGANPAPGAADRLSKAVVCSLAHNRPDKLAEAVVGLAGLGRGLTPAGDDYLVGVMAALRLTGRAELPADLITAAAAKTTWLSAAYLKAAARGEFTEPWHNLALALLAADTTATTEAIRGIAGYGASSGCDALAGFAGTLLVLYGPEHVPSFQVIDPD